MKCSKCQIDKLSREFPTDTISQKCSHVSSFCLKVNFYFLCLATCYSFILKYDFSFFLKCIINHIKATAKQCPECKTNLNANEIKELNVAWEKAPFRIDIENISQLHSQKNSTQNGEVDGRGNSTTGEFYVVRP